MARCTVAYSCGHEGHEEIAGTPRERERKVAWYRTRLCPACYKAQQDAERAQATAGLQLPALTGSEKQCAWAEKIRADAMRGIAEARAELAAQRAKWPTPAPAGAERVLAARAQALEVAASYLQNEGRAQFWIDYRDRVAAWASTAMQAAPRNDYCPRCGYTMINLIRQPAQCENRYCGHTWPTSR